MHDARPHRRSGKLGLALTLALVAACSTPDRDREVREPDPVEATAPSGVFAGIMHILYALGQWLGPRT